MPDIEELTEVQRGELRSVLGATRQQLQSQLEASREDVRPVDVDEPIGRLTRMDAMQQQSMAKANRRSAEARLQQIVACLAALEKGDYGYCTSCEEPISYPRLQARPETRLCLPCQEHRERRR